MSDFFPLLVGFLGFFTGIGINLIIEGLYIYRKFLPKEQLFLKSQGWLKYLLWPWGIKELSFMKKIRIHLVEIIFIIISLWLWYFTPFKVEFFWGFPLLIYFSIVFVIDLEFKVIFNQISLLGTVIGLLLGVYLHNITQTVLGGLVGFGIMYMMYKLGEVYVKRLSRSKGEEVDEVALGFGDVNLGGILGLILGWPGIILGLFYGVFAGGVVSLLIIIFKKIFGKYESNEAIPYAPFLILGAVVLLFFRSWLS